MFRIRLDPHSIWAWIRIRNPDPDSGTRCLKIGLKSQNLLWLTLRTRTDFNHSFLSLFQELITLGNFILFRTVKKLSTTTRRKSDFLPIKTKNYFFYNFDKAWIQDPESGSAIKILGWIRIRIKRMRIRNTGVDSDEAKRFIASILRSVKRFIAMIFTQR